MDGFRELGVWAEVVEQKLLGFGGCFPGEKRAMAAMNTYSRLLELQSVQCPMEAEENSKNSSWNPTVGDTRLRSLQVTSPHTIPFYSTADALYCSSTISPCTPSSTV